jgi:hypothetical protein
MISKFLFACIAFAMVAWPAVAQISVVVTTDQDQFLQGEALPLAVKITNRSGQQLHLGADDDWLTFNVEAYEGAVVVKNFEVPVKGVFDLESSQEAVKRVDIAPSFGLSKLGRYKVTATLHLKDWSKQINSAPKDFDIVNGAKLWSQDFGVPATNQIPETRRYTLEQASYLKAQMRLYVQVSSPAEGRILTTRSLGPSVVFGQPEALVDRYSMLHVLWQSGAQSFNYALVNSDGEILRREIYDDYDSRPHLLVDENGDLRVKGGARRPQPGEMPTILPPQQLQVSTNK